MKTFRLRAWPTGPNLIAGGIYRLRGWYTLLLWPLKRNSVAVRLPLRVREG